MCIFPPATDFNRWEEEPRLYWLNRGTVEIPCRFKTASNSGTEGAGLGLGEAEASKHRGQSRLGVRFG